jgi:hypothetical protein
MKFVRIGNQTVNLDHITHVDIVGEPTRIGVWFVGAQEPLDFYGAEAVALLTVIDARVIHIKDEALDRLMENLDLKS